MTDKLADALKAARNRIKYLGVCAGEVHAKSNDTDFLPMIDQALTAHEAAKAATPDDVQEANDVLIENAVCFEELIKMFEPHMEGNDIINVMKEQFHKSKKSAFDLHNAALCQGVTLSREVVELKSAIAAAAACLMRPNQGICDTIWFDNGTTLFEHLVSHLDVELTGDVDGDLALLDQHARGG